MLGPDTVPLFPSGVRLHHCEVRKGWFLLSPERAVKLDAIGVAILGEIDGDRTLGDVIAGLARKFEAPEEQVSQDTQRFVSDLVDRTMIAVRT